MLAWQVSEGEEVFKLWRERASQFDIDAAEAIWMLKQAECAIVLDGFQGALAHTKYGPLMQGLLDQTIGEETLNLQGRPYGGGITGVLIVLDGYLEKEPDRVKRIEAVEWIRKRVRVGEVMWELFGKAYFYWMQYERVEEYDPTLLDWVSNQYGKLGEDNELMQFQAWAHSCLTQPWNHKDKSAVGAPYDGCYVGKNGVMEEVDNFMAWMIPYHASGFKNDTCFPDWALEKLRQKGSALLQGNGTNTSANESGSDVYVKCLKELEGRSHHGKGLDTVSRECRRFVQRLVTDDESGHAEAEESAYVDEESESDGDDEEEEWVAESLEDLPDWLQQKFQAALAKHADGMNASIA
eukprot:gnl/TRDRNA2_/TRDRNA2_176359_c8_seq1.p1 gnl/TRDRNA2_/TRDRNA2_176359_c8~~gnl/TRDRNA2_/TRDRNA2_176359_c8_seq1.p1  ORF type:complete len:352 (+),score=80.67 gnl/TRDRNA2_/TRDRNA2_176359_c8_seq1:128-1183(+)